MRTTRKYDAIDLMKLWALGSTNGWNDMLKKAHLDHNINLLGRLRYQIQAGMDDLAKKKAVTDELSVFYCRLLRSLEKTAKKIIVEKNPMPGDDPLAAKKWGPEWLAAKRKRDTELALFMRQSSY